MSAIDFMMPEDMEQSGGYLSTPGTFHCVITEIKDGQGPKGKPIDGYCMTLHILGGTVPEAVGKSHTEVMWAPKLNNADGGKFGQKQHATVYTATGLVDPVMSMGKGVKIERSHMVDRQLIIKLEIDTHNSTDSATFLRLAGLNVYHVDDPRVAKVAKDMEAIALIPKELRRDKAWFDAWTKKTSGGAGGGSGGNGNGSHAGAAGGNGAKVVLDDL